MYTEFSETMRHCPGPCPAVTAVYHVFADASYQVTHPPLPPSHCIFLYVTDGEGTLSLNGTSVTLFPETICLFPSDTVFQYHTNGSLWTFWWFEFGMDSLLPGDLQRISRPADPFFFSLCEKILEQHLLGQYSTASACLGALLSYTGILSPEKADASYQRELFQKAQSEILRRLDSVTVGEAAAAVGVSPRTLNTLFRKFSGQPPKEYILSAKIRNAEYLLRSTSKSITEIASILGFSSPFHFSACFKQHHGIAPLQYRQTCLSALLPE